jgi:hypothetical protein
VLFLLSYVRESLGFLARRCVPVGEWDSVRPHGPLAGGCVAARGDGGARLRRAGAVAGQGSEYARLESNQRLCRIRAVLFH